MRRVGLLWKGLRLQAKFTLVVGIGVLALAAATVTVVAHFEFSSLEQKVRTLSERELTSLNSLVDSAMKMRLTDGQGIAIGVFEGWFESRNKEYSGKIWSVWGPSTADYMAKTAPAKPAKVALDAVDEEVLRTRQPIGRFVGDTYRYSIPIVQDEAIVSKQDICRGCHVHAMGTKAGEVINVFSTSVPVSADLAALRQRIQFMIGGALVAIMAMMLALSSIFGRIVAKPVRKIAAVLTELTNDRIVDVPYTNRGDEVGDIAQATEVFRQMVERIGLTISEIKAVAREVSNASSEISTSTTDLSQRTEEQAASLEETSASMEEIAATVKKNAENTQHANQFTSETHAVAKHGGAVVGDAVKAMARIEESSRKIVDIIGVIDEIARQTNLLALNAAVEAARAGEAGRGFAVVAIEVRSLAQRSSQAAKDIKDLIINSSGQVKEGVELVNRAGDSLQEIVTSIRKVADIVLEIANASAEQSTGLEQVRKALTQMDEITQQNSALVEENAATAKTLEHQARAMDERMSVFRLGEAAAEARERMAPRAGAAVPAQKMATVTASRPAPAAARRASG